MTTVGSLVFWFSSPDSDSDSDSSRLLLVVLLSFFSFVGSDGSGSVSFKLLSKGNFGYSYCHVTIFSLYHIHAYIVRSLQ